MLKQLTFYILLLLILAMGCASDAAHKDPKALLLKSIERSGGQYFLNSHITFNVKDLNYSIYRKEIINNFEVTREVDTTKYKATYKNGSEAYFINGIEQEETFYSKRFIEAKLAGFVYIFSIPFVFDHNSVILDQLEDVTIGKTNYHTLHVSFKPLLDDPENEFYLYINTESFLVDFFTEKYDLTGERILFRKAINRRQIDSIQIADQYILAPKRGDSTELKDIYKLYNNLTLEDLEKVELRNVKIKLLEVDESL